MNPKLKTWLSQSASAIAGGTAQAVGGYILMPANYDWAANWPKLGIVCAFGAAMAFLLFIAKCPPPVASDTPTTTV